ncbi:MAG: glycosyltransferase family 2 protein [Bacteroidia bacterium]
MNAPIVSICIPTYNGEKYIGQCIESALHQTYTNTEILIVDDGSSDNTCNIVEGFAAKDKRIRFLRNEKNLGLVANWNKCMEVAKGEWIKFLFQDDYLDADCIEIMVQSISPEDKIISSGRRLIFDPELDEATKTYSINETLTFERLGILSRIPVFISPGKISSMAANNICTNFIGEPTIIMFKKDVTEKSGTFNSDLIQICDFEFFLRIACTYGLKYVPRPLTYFRVHKGSASSSNISERSFSMANIDPIVTVRQLLYAPCYAAFRNSLSSLHKLKLKLFFMVRVYESQRAAKSSGKNNIDKFESICGKYLEINEYRQGNLFVKLAYQLIRFKRSLA